MTIETPSFNWMVNCNYGSCSTHQEGATILESATLINDSGHFNVLISGAIKELISLSLTNSIGFCLKNPLKIG